MEKKKPRKTEPCEFCTGRHYSEEARLRCFNATQKSKCECPRFWRAKWYSHSPDCGLRGEQRAELEPFTEEELQARLGTAPKTKVRRQH